VITTKSSLTIFSIPCTFIFHFGRVILLFIRSAFNFPQMLVFLFLFLKVLLASELLRGWTSPSLPANSPQEQALLQATVDAISAGKGGSDDSAAATAFSSSANGGGGPGAGKSRGRKKAGASISSSTTKAVVASKYTQPGRYHLLQMKKKAAHRRKAAADVVVVD